MTKRPDPAITGLSDDERQILVEALTALRAERGRAWNGACDLAVELGRREPEVDDYGIDAIKRLARRLGGEARHWLE